MRNARFLVFLTALLVMCGRNEGPASSTATTDTTPTIDTAVTSMTSTTSASTVTNVDTPPKGNPVDHYEFWKVVEHGITKQVPVKGQFDDDDRVVITQAVRLLGNPVQKTLQQNEPEDPTNKEVHLVAYRLAPRTTQVVTKSVEVTNQLSATAVKWVVQDHAIDPKNYPLLLLLPATKKLADFNEEAPAGPHFVCYPAVNQVPPVNGPVRLVDQFSDQHVENLIPRYLCVPVDKNHEGMWNETQHLALYEYQSKAKPSSKRAWTRDQFRKWDLQIETSVMLGVPSTKKLLPE